MRPVVSPPSAIIRSVNWRWFGPVAAVALLLSCASCSDDERSDYLAHQQAQLRDRCHLLTTMLDRDASPDELAAQFEDDADWELRSACGSAASRLERALDSWQPHEDIPEMAETLHSAGVACTGFVEWDSTGPYRVQDSSASGSCRDQDIWVSLHRGQVSVADAVQARLSRGVTNMVVGADWLVTFPNQRDAALFAEHTGGQLIAAE